MEDYIVYVGKFNDAYKGIVDRVFDRKYSKQSGRWKELSDTYHLFFLQECPSSILNKIDDCVHFNVIDREMK